MKWSDVTGVILAAGKATRMGELGLEYPKPLLPVGNVPLLMLHIHQMRRMGIQSIIVVVGHRKEMVMAYLANQDLDGVSLTLVNQNQPLGIAHAVGQLDHVIDGPLLLVLGDIYFASHNMETMLEQLPSAEQGAVLAVREEGDRDAIRKNFTADLNGEGFVTRVIEKPRRVSTTLKGCGIYLFGNAIFDAIRKTPRTAARDEYEITDSIQIMIDNGAAIRIAKVIDRDINLTFPRDLLECNLHQLGLQGGGNLVDTGASIHAGAILRNCVIGRDVSITTPVEMENCLVLAGARIDQPMQLHEMIVTPTQIIQCHSEH